MIISIDPSLTGTAVFVGQGDAYEYRRFSSKNIGDDSAARVTRYQGLIFEIMDWLEPRVKDQQIEAVFIENYSFGSQNWREYSGEYGGLLRWHMIDITPQIHEVAIGTLKKFCTGKGAGKKELIAAHLTQRYGIMFANSDEFDAFGLYQLGLVATGQTKPLDRAQREAAEKAIGREIPAVTANPTPKQETKRLPF